MSQTSSEDDAKALDRLLGERLRASREERGWTRQQLGDAIGVSVSAVQHMEDGSSRIPAARLWQLCVALDIRPADMFEDFPWREPSAAATRPSPVEPTYPTPKGSEGGQHAVCEDGPDAPAPSDIRPTPELRSLMQTARDLSPRDLKIALATVRALKAANEDPTH